VFFGVVATVGSTYVQLSRITPLSVICSIAVGFLAVALLVVNNLRDRPLDAEVGKRTLAVRLGDMRTRQLYIALMAGTAACIIGASLLRWPAIIGLAGLVSASRPVRDILDGFIGENLIPVLGETGRAQLITGAALSLGLVLGGLG
jgi:1,4-dihydroxy-2-naphthoate octaprenyltransferase